MGALRTVYARLADTSAQARAAVADELAHALQALIGAEPMLGLQAARVALPADAAAEKSWDVCVILEFADAATCVRACAPGTPLDALLAERLGAHAVVLKAWSFRTQS